MLITPENSLTVVRSWLSCLDREGGMTSDELQRLIQNARSSLRHLPSKKKREAMRELAKLQRVVGGMVERDEEKKA